MRRGDVFGGLASSLLGHSIEVIKPPSFQSFKL